MTRLRSASLALALLAAGAMPYRAFAVSKEMVQLQTQIQQLQDAVARLQQSNDERMGVMRDLVQQTADSVNKMSVSVGNLQQQMRTQNEGEAGKLDQVSGQVQSLHDSLDEMKARLARLEKGLGDLQSSQQTISAGAASNTSPATASPAVVPGPAPVDPGSPASPAKAKPGKPSAALPATGAKTPAGAPPVDDLYQTALGDYNGAKYSLAAAEFADVIQYYPDSNLAGNSYFYLGEMDYRAGKYADASKSYDHVMEQYPGNPKIPTAQWRKGQSLLALKQTDAAARELRSLIARFPNSPEAGQARSKMNGLGIRITPQR